MSIHSFIIIPMYVQATRLFFLTTKLQMTLKFPFKVKKYHRSLDMSLVDLQILPNHIAIVINV